MATYLNESELIKRLAYSMGIDVFNLVKSEEELAAEAQEATATSNDAIRHAELRQNGERRGHCTRDADACGSTPEPQA